jgi:hypothetical protein
MGRILAKVPGEIKSSHRDGRMNHRCRFGSTTRVAVRSGLPHNRCSKLVHGNTF